MKVKELIEKLQREDPEAEIMRWVSPDEEDDEYHLREVKHIYPVAQGIGGKSYEKMIVIS